MGGVYDSISKVLANMMEAELEKVISRVNNEFIKGWQILDIILVGDGCLDSRIHSGIPRVLCKLDLE